jgi:hypothetical protein
MLRWLRMTGVKANQINNNHASDNMITFASNFEHWKLLKN